MASVSEKYLDLIRWFPLRPIKSETELDKATAVMRELVDAARLTAAESDYLIILGNLIEEYENSQHPIEDLLPHVMLAESMAAKGVNQTEVSKGTGIPMSTISELLAQKREFNVQHIKKLAAYFGVGVSAFFPADTKRPQTAAV